MMRTMRGNPLPPHALRMRVSGTPSGQLFTHIGRRCRDDIARALDSIGRPLSSFRSILDFGCGSGRMLRHLAGLAHAGTAVYGCDTDTEAIAWCQRAYPFAVCAVNEYLPPLTYNDASFDLICMVSVFTHLDEERQLAWLTELRRVLQPGGILALSLHGECMAHHMTDEQRIRYEADGVMFRPPLKPQPPFPDWYGVSWHTEAYIRRAWTEWEILAYLPCGLNDHHDLVVLTSR